MFVISLHYGGALFGQATLSSGARVVIGSEPGADLPIPRMGFEHVGRHELALVLTGDGALLARRLNPVNRIYIDDSPMADERPLAPGSMPLQLGRTTFQLTIEAEFSAVDGGLGEDTSSATGIHAVAIVLDPDFGSRAHDLARRMYVWLAESPANLKARDEWAAEVAPDDDPLATGIAMFTPRAGATPEEACLDLLDTIADHHGEFAREPPMSRLLIVGARLSDRLRDGLRDMGMARIEPSEHGILCR